MKLHTAVINGSLVWSKNLDVKSKCVSIHSLNINFFCFFLYGVLMFCFAIWSFTRTNSRKRTAVVTTTFSNFRGDRLQVRANSAVIFIFFFIHENSL